jgi:hypothetical protein
MTREEARKKAIVHARAALAHARSGAVTGLSDGRKLTGADAVLFWERTLRALHNGSSLVQVWGTAGSSSESASASLEDERPGYVYGGTSLTREWASASVNSFTLGNGAESTFVRGDLEVFLSRTRSYYQESRSVYKSYAAFSQGDYVTADVHTAWDYNWLAEYAIATTSHSAKYGPYESWTTSSAIN